MIWKIVLPVVLMFSLALESGAQSFRATSLGDAAAVGSDLSLPITVQLELEITDPGSMTELVKYLDTQNFAIRINYHVRKGGDPTRLEKAVLQAFQTRIFTASEITKLDSEVKRIAPSSKDRKAIWRFNQSMKGS